MFLSNGHLRPLYFCSALEAYQMRCSSSNSHKRRFAIHASVSKDSGFLKRRAQAADCRLKSGGQPKRKAVKTLHVAFVGAYDENAAIADRKRRHGIAKHEAGRRPAARAHAEHVDLVGGVRPFYVHNEGVCDPKPFECARCRRLVAHFGQLLGVELMLRHDFHVLRVELDYAREVQKRAVRLVAEAENASIQRCDGVKRQDGRQDANILAVA